MTDVWKERVKAALQSKGISMKAASLAAGKGETFVRDMLERDRAPSIENFLALARVVEKSVGFLLGDEEPTVKIVGKAAANPHGEILFDNGDGNLGETLVPEGASLSSSALEVEGYSMGFLADGALIFYEDRHFPPTPDMLGLIVIVGLPDGRVLLKKLLRGSEADLYDLESIHGPILKDQRVQWAAHVDSVVPPWRAGRLKR